MSIEYLLKVEELQFDRREEKGSDSREERAREKGLENIVGFGVGTNTREIEKKLRENKKKLGWKEPERRHRFNSEEARAAGKKGHRFDSKEAKEAGKKGHRWNSDKAREAAQKRWKEIMLAGSNDINKRK